MKRILSILAVALAVTAWYAMPAAAAKIDVGGEFEARGYYISEADLTKDSDENWIDARFRLDANIQQGMTTAVVQLDLLGNSSSDSAGVTDNGFLIMGNSTGNSYDLVGVRQAYLAIAFPAFTLVGGRYEVKLGNGLVLNDTTDIIAVSAPIGPVNLLAGYLMLGEDDSPLGSRPTNGWLPSSFPGDDTAFAVNVGLNDLAGSGWDANVFFVSVNLQGVDPDAVLRVIGLTGNGQVGPVALNAELDIFSGDADSTDSLEGTNFLLSGTLPANSVGLPVGINAALIYASGQDSSSSDININAIDGDFRASNILFRDDFNNYEGVSSLNHWTSLGVQAIKVAVNLPTIDFAGMMHSPEIGLVFAQTTEDDADGDSDLGTEIYLNTNCEVDKNLSANVGIAFLSAGDAHFAGSSPEDQMKLEASLKFHF